jgi:hypothetical protein
MHAALVREIVANCFQRERDGDCPSVTSFSVDMLEDCVRQMARDLKMEAAQSTTGFPPGSCAHCGKFHHHVCDEMRAAILAEEQECPDCGKPDCQTNH